MILAFESYAAQLTGKSSLVAVRQFVFGKGRRARKHFTTHLSIDLIWVLKLAG
jgi:hypothetical protein